VNQAGETVLALAATCILLTWAVCAAILVGLGTLVARTLTPSYDLLDALWIGLIACAVFLGIWNLFLPVTAIPGCLLAGIGVLGLYRDRRWLAERVKQIARFRALLGIYAVLLAGIAIRAAGPCEYYDTGLYGAQAVRWIQTYPTVFGLANVHGRLGFNSPVFLFDAALSHGPWGNLYFHLFGGFILCVLWAVVLPSCRSVIRADNPTAADWFRVIVAVALSVWSVRGTLVGTTTDEPSTLVCLAAAAVLFEEMDRHRSGGAADSHRLLKLTIATMLFALAVTFKLSVLVLALLGWILGFAILYSARHQSRLVWVVVAGAMAVVAPWVAARVILSGYPLFPSTALAFPCDWRVPRGVANMYQLWIRSWGRAGVQEAYGLGWLRPWLHDMIRNRSGFQVPLAIALCSLINLTVKRESRTVNASNAWLLLPSAAGIIFWFWESPDPRFGQAAIWTFAATLGALAIRGFTGSALMRQRIAVGLLGLATLWCLFSFGWRHSYRVLRFTNAFAGVPEAEIVARETVSGLTLYVPVINNQCWNAPLPCTPYFDANLTTHLGWHSRLEFVSDVR